ncbi:conjugative transfer signal peptidase TraF [Xanthomonas perforans]|uniref:conjugative transfer signal peptidase TraF n=1 Tax=Xanthomonas perforans TaxID=442694 RepID=UPI00235941CB|nr:conjugative transfer signal peptidase TraF [Xanthomonas perforans]MEB2158954.1 conjugative transfer signal peptidase TraF [Xanthomonas campestris pv. campestris]
MKVTFLATAVFGVLVGGAAAYGYRINATASAPIGLWRVTFDAAPLEHGAMVSICPPPTAIVKAVAAKGYLGPGQCPVGTEPLLKPITALPGDLVTVSLAGVAVNGHQLKNSRARPSVLGLRPMQQGTYTVAPRTLWLISSYSADSFDSRYFGPVSDDAIQGYASPVLVVGEMKAIYGGEQ